MRTASLSGCRHALRCGTSADAAKSVSAFQDFCEVLVEFLKRYRALAATAADRHKRVGGLPNVRNLLLEEDRPSLGSGIKQRTSQFDLLDAAARITTKAGRPSGPTGH